MCNMCGIGGPLSDSLSSRHSAYVIPAAAASMHLLLIPSFLGAYTIILMGGWSFAILLSVNDPRSSPDLSNVRLVITLMKSLLCFAIAQLSPA